VADEYQLGLRYAPGSRHTVDIEFYANDIDDLIEFDLATFTLVNIDAAEIRGVQLGYEYLGDGFSLRTDMVSQRAENTTSGTRLLRRAEESITVSYAQDVGRHRLGLSVLASGDREDFGGVILPGYAVASLTGQFQLSRHLQLNARVENLFDAEYQTAADFRMQGRSAFVEIKYRRPYRGENDSARFTRVPVMTARRASATARARRKTARASKPTERSTRPTARSAWSCLTTACRTPCAKA
jgi:vitamin B12 transporter